MRLLLALCLCASATAAEFASDPIVYGVGGVKEQQSIIRKRLREVLVEFTASRTFKPNGAETALSVGAGIYNTNQFPNSQWIVFVWYDGDKIDHAAIWITDQIDWRKHPALLTVVLHQATTALFRNSATKEYAGPSWIGVRVIRE